MYEARYALADIQFLFMSKVAQWRVHMWNPTCYIDCYNSSKA
jgi:hypothetical protein